ncbi:MAG: putative inorganic carbon transporter subunit DabA, partial [Halobacterium sp.]
GADAVAETERRTADWAETRPEWGLAGNASFVIGPRELTADSDLDGRAFLHSYDWTTDPDGDALEAIVEGPLVVTQWINCQYYFATVDNAVYGSGSKTTQNPTGNVGVYQGNGGDLMTGLPLQSLNVDDDRPYHQPLRLSAVIHAPVERVEDVLRRNESVAELLDNGWLSLTVLDPQRDDEAFHYQGEMEWEPAVAQPVLQ